MLENAIILSQNTGGGGQIGLHAADAGGSLLFKLYAHCGLTNLDSRAAMPASVHRKNDGRFLFADEIQAETLATLLHPYR